MGRSNGDGYRSFEVTQPWILYHHGRVHDRLWPIWHSTRVRCHTRITLECCVCGDRRAVALPSPRLLPIGQHPAPREFLNGHAACPDRRRAEDWARPLVNVDAFRRAGGTDAEMLMPRRDREAAS